MKGAAKKETLKESQRWLLLLFVIIIVIIIIIVAVCIVIGVVISIIIIRREAHPGESHRKTLESLPDRSNDVIVSLGSKFG